ncbi:MAG: aminoglycoside 6-adenylyltransferase [Peptoniphilaceae bacterium]|nr:aminoglycoside 6-adenylyltransferase [Peptoniphilaceae bacterium]MDY6085369.1 aminoglycoside 6-adenylyltransferase [Peptoniphilaceae bacterium]
MENETIVQHAVVAWAHATEGIGAVFATGARENPAAVQKKTMPYRYIVESERGAAPVMEEDWAERLQEKVLQLAVVAHQPDVVRLFMANDVRVTFCVVAPEDLETALAADSLARAVYDPEARFAERPAPTDLTLRFKAPTPERVTLWCNQFFMNMTDVALALYDDEPWQAQTYLDAAREALIPMAFAAAASESGFFVNLGERGENLKAYMSDTAYDHLMRSYAPTDAARIWDALFQACMLFRKCGLKLDELDGYTYPRKMDVEMMQYFRRLWEETR